jgi:hypothetical protein
MIYRISKAVGVWLALLALVMLAIAALRNPGTGNVPDRPVPPASSPAATSLVQVHAGCVIRGDGGWHIYRNFSHYCGALTGVHTEPDGDLVLDLAGTHRAVEDQQIGTDETFSRFADCGLSGGVTITVVRCFDNGGARIRAQDPRWDNPYGNLWFSITWRDEPTP